MKSYKDLGKRSTLRSENGGHPEKKKGLLMLQWCDLKHRLGRRKEKESIWLEKNREGRKQWKRRDS